MDPAARPLQRVTTQARDAWLSEVQQAMRDAKAGGATPHALFFLHGFNVSFEDAAILAASDVDRDLFLHLARLYPEHSERTTLYASDGDLPVHLSARMHPGRVRDA